MHRIGYLCKSTLWSEIEPILWNNKLQLGIKSDNLLVSYIIVCLIRSYNNWLFRAGERVQLNMSTFLRTL